MIRYTPGFAPTTDGVAAKPANTVKPLPLSVEQARALAAQRQSQVLDYSRRASTQTPLKQNLRADGPTLEKWIEAGYQPGNYPPEGYSEVDSPGLTAYKAKVAADTKSGPHSVNDKPEEKS
jgi:hypothetical protein